MFLSKEYVMITPVRGDIMQNIKIGTWNLKNTKIKLTSDRRKVASIIDLLEKEELDFLSIQKANDFLISQLTLALGDTNYYLDHSLKEGSIVLPNRFVRNDYVILNKDFLFKSAVQDSRDYTKSKNSNDNLKLNIVDATKKDLELFILNTNIDDKENMQLDELGFTIDIIQKRLDKRDLIITGDFNKTIDSNSLPKLRREMGEYRLKILNNIDNYISSYLIIPSDYLVDEVYEVDDYTKSYTNNPTVAKVKVR